MFTGKAFTMASGGARRLFEEDDKVDEYLLNQVSKWVLYHRLPSLARDLGLSHADFSRIVGRKSQPEEQIFEVCFKRRQRFKFRSNFAFAFPLVIVAFH